MKLHEIARQARALGIVMGENSGNRERQEKLLEMLHFNSGNFYQEIEMDDPLVQTQEDISTTEDVVGLHSHVYYEIIFIRSGNLQYLIGTRRYRIQRGDILLIAPGVSHRPLFLERLQEKYARIVVWVSPACAELLRAQWPDLDELNRLPCMLRTGDLPTDSIAAYEAAFRRGVRVHGRRAGLGGCGICQYPAAVCIAAADFGSGRVAQPAAEKRELLDEIMSYVEDHLAGHITLDDTARQFHVSASTLVSQLFRKRMGVSYYRFVTQRRLIAAKTLIKEGTALDTVAESVGFSDYSGFYRAFKQEYGISPTRFKNAVTVIGKQSQAKTTKRHRRKSDALLADLVLFAQMPDVAVVLRNGAVAGEEASFRNVDKGTFCAASPSGRRRSR